MQYFLSKIQTVLNSETHLALVGVRDRSLPQKRWNLRKSHHLVAASVHTVAEKQIEGFGKTALLARKLFYLFRGWVISRRLRDPGRCVSDCTEITSPNHHFPNYLWWRTNFVFFKCPILMGWYFSKIKKGIILKGQNKYGRGILNF